MKNESFWTAGVPLPSYSPLEKNTVADVAIIGAGITGLMSAYLIAQSGRRVVILEKGTVASGATHVTTAFLTQIIDTDVIDLLSLYGRKGTKSILNSHAEAIDLIEEIVKTEKIDCDFKRCSNYVYAADDKELQDLMPEYEAMQRSGLRVSLVRKPIPHLKSVGYAEVMDQAKFHPMKFIAGLLPALDKLGVSIFEETEAITLDEEHPNHLVLKTVQGLEVSANWVISAAYQPFGQPLGIFFKKGMYVSYVLEAEIKKGALEEGIYEDMDNPYHYFRLEPGEKSDTVIFGGEDHREEVPIDPEKNFTALRKHLDEALIETPTTIRRRWSGPILEPSDGLPLIGPYKNPNVLYAAGFSGNGMTYAAIAATTFKDLVEGKKPQSYDLYRTDRALKLKSLYRKAIDYGEEFIRGAGRNIWRRKDK